MINTLDFNNKISIMGILNLTPDSFYDGGKWGNKKELLSQVERWVELGIDFIDVGCESSRPGSIPISIEEEINRLNLIIPIIKLFPEVYFSIDTYKPKVAEFALENGFKIINDIFGARNKDMFKIAKKYNSPIIIMHMKGEPQNMQINPSYNKVIDEIVSFFQKKIDSAIACGINPNQIILDPGIGFGKSLIDNDVILKNINKIKSLGYPVLLGTSRKSFLKVNDSPNERLANSISSMTIGMLNGANIFRVHDVEDSLKVKALLERYVESNCLELKIL
jgi:dihydropteroate synthase